MSAETSRFNSSCPRCGTLLTADEVGGRCPRCLASALFAATSPTLAPEATGLRRVGDYELIEEIARGGMGVVYRARQVSLNRIVAVKLMRDRALAGPDEVRRFKLEAAAAAKLKHSNIVAIHEVGETDGQHWFAMDLVEGDSLAQQTRDGPLAPKAAASLVATIADAVQHAHERGVLHRDLKPSNVLLDGQGQPVVTDFGLARTLEGDSSLTLTGQVLGTPGYMPPEQATGKGTVGPAADIYSLGALLYHLLTGRAPFVGGTPAETMRHVVEQEPVSPQLLNPEVPRDLASVCLKCLAKRAGERYVSSAELAADLRRFGRGEPTVARPAGMARRVGRWCQRQPALAGSLALTCFVAVGGFLGVLWQWRDAVAARNSSQRSEVARVEQLWESLCQQAQFSVRSGKIGQRTNTLAAVGLAAAIRPSLELRNDAIAALLLPDLGSPLNWKTQPDYLHPVAWSRDLEYYVPHVVKGRITVRRPTDHRVVADLGEAPVEPNFTGQFSVDGRQVAILFHDGLLRVWDWRAARTLAEVRCPKPIWGLRPFDFSPDGESVFFADETHGVSRVRLGSADIAPVLDTRPAHIVRVSPSGRWIAVARRTEVEIWDAATRKLLSATNLSVAAPSLLGMAWHPNEELLALGGVSALFLWPWRNGEATRVSGDAEAQEHYLPFFNGTGDLLFSSIGVWDVATASRLLSFESTLVSVALSGDGRRLAGSKPKVGFGIWDFHSPIVLRKFVTTAGAAAVIRTLDAHPEGHWILAGGRSGWFLFDVQTGRVMARDPLHSPRPRGIFVTVKFSSDGTAFHSIDHRGLLRWVLPESSASNRRASIAVGEPETLFAGLPGAEMPGTNPGEIGMSPRSPEQSKLAVCEGGEISADGHFAALVGNGGAVRFDLNRRTLSPVARLKRASDNIIAFSPDGRWLATTRNNEAAGPDLYDLEEGRPVRRLAEAGASGPLWFPRTGEFITQSSTDARFWEPDVWTFRRRFSWPNPGMGIGFVGFSPDGRRGWLNGPDGTFQIVDVEKEQIEITVPPLPSQQLHTWAAALDAPRRRLFLAHAQSVLAFDFPELQRELARRGLDWPH